MDEPITINDPKEDVVKKEEGDKEEDVKKEDDKEDDGGVKDIINKVYLHSFISYYNAEQLAEETVPKTNEKWAAAIVVGILFAVISNPFAYYVTSTITTTLGGMPLTVGQGPNPVGLIIHTIVFILIVRLILG
jgi:hypothetical protein